MLIFGCSTPFKGVLNNFSPIPHFFFSFQKSWDFYTIRSVQVYVVTAHLILLANSITKIRDMTWLLNLAPSTIILVWRKILQLVCAVMLTLRYNSYLLESATLFGKLPGTVFRVPFDRNIFMSTHVVKFFYVDISSSAFLMSITCQHNCMTALVEYNVTLWSATLVLKDLASLLFFLPVLLSETSA